MFNGDGDPLRWVLRTKVSKEDHDLIEEFANHQSNGNLSGLLRTMISDWLALAVEEGSDDLPVEVRLRVKARHRQKRRRFRDDLRLAFLSLADDPDAEYEADLATMAKKYNLPWPPEDVKPSQVDPDLKRINERLQVMWRENGHGGAVTLRALQSRLNGYRSADLRGHLERLESEGIVVLDGVRAAGNTLTVRRPV